MKYALRISLLIVIVGTCCTGQAIAHTGYEAWLVPLADMESEWRGDSFGGGFSGETREEHPPDCSVDRPMHFSLHTPSLTGELTAVVLRLGDENGEVVFRLPPTASTIPFEAGDCEILEDWTDVEPFDTPYFVVLETATHPAGEMGARLRAFLTAPTLERTWGQVKSRYRLAK